MMRSLYAGVSGLNLHQTRMDVLGNNIANINTNGFKSSRANFAQMYTQTLNAGTAATSSGGGTNPTQVGLGVGLGSIDLLFEQGSTQSTGRTNDLALQGNGLFAVNASGQKLYTRNGNFGFDSSGNFVVEGQGYKVQGWLPGPDGKIVPTDTTSDIKIDKGNIPGTKSSSLTVGGNLKSSTSIGGTASIPATVYSGADSGASMLTSFTKVADRTWLYNASSTSGGVVNPTGLGQITFDSNGNATSTKLLRPNSTDIVNFTSAFSISNIQLNNSPNLASQTMGFTFYDGDNTLAPSAGMHAINMTTTFGGTFTSAGSGTSGSYWTYDFAAQNGGVASNGDTPSMIYQFNNTAAGGSECMYVIQSGTNFIADAATVAALSASGAVYTQLKDLVEAAGGSMTGATFATTGNIMSFQKQVGSSALSVSVDATGWIKGEPSPNSFNMTTVPPLGIVSAAYTMNVNSQQFDGTKGSVHDEYITLIDATSTPRVFKFTTECTAENQSWSYTMTEMGNTDNVTTGSITYTSGSGYSMQPASFSYDCDGVNGGITTVTMSTGTSIAPAAGMFSFNYTPQYELDNNAGVSIQVAATSGAAPQSLQLKTGTMTQYDSATNLTATTDGTSTGSLQNTSIDQNGIIIGTYSNGATKNLAQIAIANCDNPAGLQQYASTFYLESQNSGKVTCNVALSGGRGTIQSGSLEMSNVDLASAFSDMIVTQRGYQANTKIIQTASDMLQELVNLKR